MRNDFPKLRILSIKQYITVSFIFIPIIISTWDYMSYLNVQHISYSMYVSCRPDNHFLEAICCFPMVYYMAGTIDK